MPSRFASFTGSLASIRSASSRFSRERSACIPVSPCESSQSPCCSRISVNPRMTTGLAREGVREASRGLSSSFFSGADAFACSAVVSTIRLLKCWHRIRASGRVCAWIVFPAGSTSRPGRDVPRKSRARTRFRGLHASLEALGFHPRGGGGLRVNVSLKSRTRTLFV